ncbi:TPA: helix-turn-helix domain-containing protein [Providencia alcalifaciens]
MNDINELLIKNIKHLMDTKGISNHTELARRLKMHQPTMHRLLSGEVKDPKISVVKNIADFFHVPLTDLTDADLTKKENGVPQSAISVNYASIPVVGRAQLGEGGCWSDLQYPIGMGEGYIHWPTSDPDAYALLCVGDSMIPRIKEGEFVIIEPNHAYSPGDEVLLVTSSEETMVKTYLYKRDGYIYLSSINDAHPPIKVEQIKVDKIHYVAGIAKPSLWYEKCD